MRKNKIQIIRDWATSRKQRKNRTNIKMTEYNNGIAQKTKQVVW